MPDHNSPWQSIDRSQLHEVTDPAQVAILSNPTRVAFLIPFLARDNTVAAAAAELGCSANTLLYRVRRMVAVGLLRVVRVQARAGRPIRHYRSSHDGYLVPFSAMRDDDLLARVGRQGEPLSRSLTRAYTDILSHSTDHARVVARNVDGQQWQTDLPPDRTATGQPLAFWDQQVSLTREQADALHQAFLAALDQTLQAPSDPGARLERYLVSAALLPLRE